MVERDPRSKILAAAEELFAAKGFAATVREIAAAAGMNLAMIHYYFGNKEGLYRAVFEEKVVAMQQLMAELQATPEPHRRRLEGFVRGYTRFMCTHHHFARMLQREFIAGGEVISEIVRPQIARNYATLHGIVRDGVAAGEFRAVDTAMTPVSLVGSIAFFLLGQPLIAGVLGTCVTDEDFEERLAEHTLNLYLHGILVDKEEPQ
jgi:AcrR family transcriptional regulator